ncbi:unnamed protein product [Diatraea saccharalis]|uniref:Uncharacterized protein n=1 Tax=Diatraea saccharalis TaxID=40085 RepID=A0A9N9QV51_9NEOP|nr:unnamed protein product [Diatraea saccharalis]
MLNNDKIEHQDNVEECTTNLSCHVKDVQYWAVHCRTLISCNKKLNDCLSSQVFDDQRIVLENTPVFMTNLTSTSLNIIILTYICQKLHNAWDGLTNSLIRVQIGLLKNPDTPEIRVVRDLVRLMSQEPVRAYLLNTLPLSMPLVPATLSVIITHIIVLLQFYHVLN